MRHRNQLTITLNGTEYVLRGTLEALDSIEEKTGKTIFEIVKEASVNDIPSIRISDIRTIVIQGTRGAGQTIDLKRLAEDITEEGIAKTSTLVANFLAAALWGGEAFDDENAKQDGGEKKVMEDALDG